MMLSRRSAIASAAALACVPGVALAAKKGDDEAKKPESEPFGRLTVDQVERRLGRPDVHVYDGNNDETYADAHIPGAVRLYSKTMTAKDLPPDKNATLIFYCHNLL